ncbi:hypothetical protein [Azohydromonas australica]|uniref:hypothetical protein n=1 Tax=Azohydromonas australica TaxID=364039 RepID=UPI00041D3AD6|nr:hypothetical protein [Azohydromonas australica]
MDKQPSRRGSHFADRQAAEQALALTLPMIEAAMADPMVSGCGFFYLVVMDPALTPADCPFEEAVLLEHAVGDRSRWDADYAGFARAKARLAWNQGDTHALQTQQPHRLREGDSLLWGSAVLDGIVVAASGAFPWFDEAFATALAANLRAIAKQRHAAALEKRQLHAGG